MKKDLEKLWIVRYHRKNRLYLRTMTKFVKAKNRKELDKKIKNENYVIEDARLVRNY